MKLVEDEVAETSIDYPEIERVSGGKTVTSPKRAPVTRYKSKLANATLKIMSKLYMRDEAVEEVDEDRASDVIIAQDEKQDGGISPKRKTSVILPPIHVAPASPDRTQKVSNTSVRGFAGSDVISPSFRARRPSRPNLASVVRIERFKRNLRSRTGSFSSDVSVDEDTKTDLPEKPRFCATLSPEAQYAMMKGYEDLLLSQIKEKERGKQKMESEGSDVTDGLTPATVLPPLYRVKTPHHKVVSVHLNSLERRQQQLLLESQRVQQRLANASTTSLFGPPDTLTVTKFPALTSQSSASIAAEDPWHKIPKDKQLWLTYRFQCAMDILDKMREEKGLMVTSPRFRQKTINPVVNYNMWSQAWSREFKLELSRQ